MNKRKKKVPATKRRTVQPKWEPEDQAEFDAALDELFEMLFQKVEDGEITLDQTGGFFPKDVQDRNA